MTLCTLYGERRNNDPSTDKLYLYFDFYPYSFIGCILRCSGVNISDGGPGTVFNYPKGELRVGKNTVWTKEGLSCSIVKYELEPNNTDVNWSAVDITVTDGNTVTGRGIENVGKSNFINVFREFDNKVIWIPFQAIEALRLEKTVPKTFKMVKVKEEMNGWFHFEYEPFDIESLNFLVEVSLLFPNINGETIIRGWLLESNKKLVVFQENGSKEVPWASVTRLIIRRDKTSHYKSTESGPPPKFVYRTLGQWSNVWKEWSIPSGN